MNEIEWKDGLPKSRFCCMTTNGIIEIRDRPRAWPYQIAAAELKEKWGFAKWLNHLQKKSWFTPPLREDFISFVTDLRDQDAGRWK